MKIILGVLAIIALSTGSALAQTGSSSSSSSGSSSGGSSSSSSGSVSSGPGGSTVSTTTTTTGNGVAISTVSAPGISQSSFSFQGQSYPTLAALQAAIRAYFGF